MWFEAQNRAERTRARAIAAFAEDLLCVDELNDDAVVTLFDCHHPGHEIEEVTDEIRNLIVGTRWLLARLSDGVLSPELWTWIGAGLQLMKNRATKKRRPERISQKRREMLRILSNANSWPSELRHEQTTHALFCIDGNFSNIHPEIADVLTGLQSGSIRSLEHAAAMLTVAAKVFDDHKCGTSKDKAVRAARTKFDAARRSGATEPKPKRR